MAEPGRGSRPQSTAIAPRLVNLKQMAEYLGCSYWTARDYVLAGFIPVVNLPPLRPREGERPRTTLRRVLVDREDLDRFIEARKQAGAQVLQSPVPPMQGRKPGRNRAAVPMLCPNAEVAR